MKKNTIKRTTYNKICDKIIERKRNNVRGNYHYRGAYYFLWDGKLDKLTDEDAFLFERGLVLTLNWQTLEVID